MHEVRPEVAPIGSYNRFSYALFHTVGVGGMFDMLRYERAFLIRPDDVARLLSLADEPGGRNYIVVLVGKYDSGKKATWTDQRLMSHARLERIDDAGSLLELVPAGTRFEIKPPKPLKFRSTIEVEDSVRNLLKIMLVNRAMPETENHTHQIEGCFYALDLDRVLRMKLTTFFPSEADAEAGWRI